MKKHKHISLVTAMIISFALVLFSGCASEHSHDEAAGYPTTLEETHHDHQGDKTELALNNGAKWNADSVTQENVTEMQKLITSLNPSTLDNYHDAGNKIQENIQKLINNCSMKGPDHDALHLWLEPLLELNGELTKSKTIEEGASAFSAVRDQVNIYFQYFE